MLISAGIGLFLAIKWGPPTFDAAVDVGIPVLSGLAGFLVTLIIYWLWLYPKARRSLWADSQASIATALARAEEAKEERRARESQLQGQIEDLTQTLAKKKIGLSVEVSIDYLPHAYPFGWSAELVDAERVQREFAIVTVRNVGERTARDVFAKCRIANSDETIACHWSKESNAMVAFGGNRAGDLNVQQQRGLLIAQVFGVKKIWARLAKNEEILFRYPIYANDSLAVEKREAAWATSREAESLDLGEKVELIVSFHSEDVNHMEHVFLDFDSNGYRTIRLENGATRIDGPSSPLSSPVPPPAIPPETTASE
ncbi:MAG: hypothetical protein WAM82_08760 [Thermoanaerobaculia bacterium]